MQTVVLDTNALLMPFEIRINLDLALKGLLGDVRCVVPGPLIGELKKLDHKFSKAALELARKYDIVQTPLSGDDAVIDVATSTGGYILTNDKDLRARARKQEIPLIYLRSSNHLIVETFK
jgi:rRNA-processing protein FCF1